MELYEDIKERTDLCEMACEGLRTEYLRHLQLLGTTIDKEVRLIMSHRDDEIQQLRNRVAELEEANKLLEADDSNRKKALEFAEYMAKCTEQFMVTVNELDIADEQENEMLIDILQERRGEYWRAVNTSIYEFRKRAAKEMENKNDINVHT